MKCFSSQKELYASLSRIKNGDEHSVHFAMENQFIADYSNFLLQRPAMYSLRALEDTETIILSYDTVNWGYENLKQGDRLGRRIAELYFIYKDHRINNLLAKSPREA